jgi:hypothetical protein
MIEQVSYATDMPRDSKDDIITRLELECEQLRWERDLLAAQAANVEVLWRQLTTAAAECDNLRAELSRLQDAPSPPGGAAGGTTDQLTWIAIALTGRQSDEILHAQRT